MGELFLDIEEEASIVNSYLNSQKTKRDNAQTQTQSNSTDFMLKLKSMQTIIRETIKEREQIKE